MLWKSADGLITSHHFQWYRVLYFPKTLNVRIILDWFDFRCKFGFGENKWSVVKRSPARFQLFPTNFRPIASNSPEKITAGRPFRCPYRNVEICRFHRAQEYESPRAENPSQN